MARLLGIRPDVLGRLVSSVTFFPDFLELGLNLRVAKRPKVRPPPGTPQEWLVLPQYCRMQAVVEKPNMSLDASSAAAATASSSGGGGSLTNPWAKGASQAVVTAPAAAAAAAAGRPGSTSTPQFEFSGRAVQLVQEYAQRFPQLLNYLVRVAVGVRRGRVCAIVVVVVVAIVVAVVVVVVVSSSSAHV